MMSLERKVKYVDVISYKLLAHPKAYEVFSTIFYSHLYQPEKYFQCHK